MSVRRKKITAKTSGRTETATARRMEARQSVVEQAHLVAEAFRSVALGLVPLDFETRRHVLKWAAELYLIDPGKLGP